MSRKSLDSILTDVDEPEESLDNEQPAEIEAEAPVDELEDSPDNDVSEEQPAEAKAKEADPKDKAEPEDDSKKDGLPPWMHAKLKAKEEKAAAAERQAQELQRQLEQVQQQIQQQPQHQPSLEEYLAQMQATQAQQALETRKAMSKRFAIADFGEEEVKQAEAWAFDACAADPALNQRMYNSDDPFRDAIMEYRKAQSFVELEKYGGDLNKLVEAKLAERGQVQTDEPASPQVSSQQQKMPGNFSGTPSARTGRSGPSFTGPTPLGDLLNN